MKNSLHTNPLMFKIVVLLTCFMLVMMYNKSKAQSCYKTQFSAKHHQLVKKF